MQNGKKYAFGEITYYTVPIDPGMRLQFSVS
jgi:hypothetical protein